MNYVDLLAFYLKVEDPLDYCNNLDILKDDEEKIGIFQNL